MDYDSNKTILMLGTDINTRGGISFVVKQIINSKIKNDFNIIYVSTHCDGSKFKKIQKFITGFFLYIYYILLFSPNIIHIHSASRASFYRKSIFLIIAKLLRKKIIFHLHGAEFKVFYLQECSALKRKYIKFILKQTDLIIALSNSWSKFLSDVLPNHPIKVLPNAVSIPKLPQKNFSNNLPVILYMGRIGLRKGFSDLLKAGHILKSNGYDFRCVICGDGDIKYWKEQCSAKGLSNQFIFKGWITGSEKHVIFCSSDIYVLPSYNEGMPMSLLEAMSYSLPVITTNVGGIPEIIDDGINGYIINPGDYKKLAVLTEFLINNDDKKMEIALAGKNTIVQDFSIDKYIINLIQIYKSI